MRRPRGWRLFPANYRAEIVKKLAFDNPGVPVDGSEVERIFNSAESGQFSTWGTALLKSPDDCERCKKCGGDMLHSEFACGPWFCFACSPPGAESSTARYLAILVDNDVVHDMKDPPPVKKAKFYWMIINRTRANHLRK